MHYRKKQGFEAAGEVAVQVMEGMRTHGAENVFQVTVYPWGDQARQAVCLKSVPPALLPEELS